jgi:hypothetical protein
VNRRHLSRPAVDDAVSALSAAVEDLRPVLKRAAVEAIARDVIRTYLLTEQAELSRRHDGRMSDITKKLTAMEVGDRVLIESTPPQAVRARMKTARRAMDNAQAVFVCDTMADGRIRITRLEDGASAKVKRVVENPKARELASLQINQEIISTTLTSLRGAGQMGPNTKIAARKLIGAPGADWTVRQTEKGVLLKRTR